MKSGFTLIELSIVLVIIGLLIGGILTAQSLIKSASISSTVKQFNEVDIAVGLFIQKYRQIPGDSNLINPLGNNNGRLQSNGSGFAPLEDESSYFFYDLSLGVSFKNQKGGNFGRQISPFTEDNAFIPAMSDYAETGTERMHAADSNGSSPESPYANAAGFSLYYGSRSSFKPIDAYAMDKKMDDGLPRMGYISYEGSTGDDGVCIDGPRTDPRESVNYNLAVDDYRCGMTIVHGFAAGRF